MVPLPPSRYAGIPMAEIVTNEGRPIAYLRRRFLPPLDLSAPAAEHAVRDGDRLDVVAAQFLGDPELFWKLADANRSLNPFELIPPVRVPDRPPVRLRIPLLGG